MLGLSTNKDLAEIFQTLKIRISFKLILNHSICIDFYRVFPENGFLSYQGWINIVFIKRVYTERTIFMTPVLAHNTAQLNCTSHCFQYKLLAVL